MKFLVLGASGATGRLLTDYALGKGHDIVAYVRDPATFKGGIGISLVKGDVRDADSLTEAMRGTDAVISTLGLGSASKPNDLILDTTRAVVEAATRSGTQRVLFMSAFGVADSLAKASMLMRLLYQGGKETFADKAAGEKILTSSELDWTLVYPVLLTTKPASGKTRAIDLAALTRLPGMPRISRADVAEFLVQEATKGVWTRRTAVLTTGQ